MVTGYCVKCKKKAVELTDPEIHQTKKGGFMAEVTRTSDIKTAVAVPEQRVSRIRGS